MASVLNAKDEIKKHFIHLKNKPYNMKSIVKFPIIIGIAGSILFTSCTNKEKEEAALAQVSTISSSRDSLENELVTTMDEINHNLDQIRDKQGMITNSNGPESISKKQQILANIQAINALIADNQEKIAKLESQTKKLGKEKGAMARIAEQTKFRIKRQEDEIAMLKDQLANESYKVDDLNKKVKEMQAYNDTLTGQKNLLAESNTQMDKDMNKAWFMYGTHKELKAKELVESAPVWLKKEVKKDEADKLAEKLKELGGECRLA